MDNRRDQPDVGNSEPTVPKKHKGMALLPKEQMLPIESATRACMPADVSEPRGCHRGSARRKYWALRWSDIEGNDVVIARVADADEARAGVQGHQNRQTAASRLA
jgi:hypothetical protein